MVSPPSDVPDPSVVPPEVVPPSDVPPVVASPSDVPVPSVVPPEVVPPSDVPVPSVVPPEVVPPEVAPEPSLGPSVVPPEVVPEPSLEPSVVPPDVVPDPSVMPGPSIVPDPSVVPESGFAPFSTTSLTKSTNPPARLAISSTSAASTKVSMLMSPSTNWFARSLVVSIRSTNASAAFLSFKAAPPVVCTKLSICWLTFAVLFATAVIALVAATSSPV